MSSMLEYDARQRDIRLFNDAKKELLIEYKEFNVHYFGLLK